MARCQALGCVFAAIAMLSTSCADREASCGDGAVAGAEACDDGNTTSETECPYGVPSCTTCDASCSTVVSLIGAFCGDGTANGPEACDDGNTVTESACPPGVATCGACTAGCDAVLSLTGAVLALAGGDRQTGWAGEPLAEPLRVRVTNGGVGVPGVTVRWAIDAGGGALSSDTTTTGSDGEASVGWTLGAVAGVSQASSAAFEGYAGAPVSFSATAIPGPPARLAFIVQPTTTPSSSPMSPAPQIALFDAHDNVTGIGAGNVAITLATNPTGATLSGETVATPAGGLVTFPGLAVDRSGAGYRLAAELSGLAAAWSDPFDVTLHLDFVVQPSDTFTAVPISPSVVVRATDAGAPVPGVEVSLAVEGSGGASITGDAEAQTGDAGTATFAGVELDRRGSGYRLVATATPLGGPRASAVSASFHVLAVDREQPTIDGSSGVLAITGDGSQQKLAQVVTVGAAGVLDAVRVPVACRSGTFTVSLRGVRPDGSPDSTDLAAQSFPATALASFHPTIQEYPLLRFATPGSFRAGDRVALVLEASSECVMEIGPNGDTYPGGDGYFDARPNPTGWIPLDAPTKDLVFQTVMR